MRILTLGPSGSFGGLQTHFKRLNSFLEAEGHRVLQIHMLSRDSSTGVNDNSTSGDAVTIQFGKTQLEKLWALPGLGKAVFRAATFRPDLVIACAIGNAYALIGKSCGTNCTRFYHEVIGDVPPRHPLRTKMAHIYGHTACQSPRLVQSVRRAVRPLPKIGVLPCFADPIGERSPMRALPPAKSGPVKLGFFGRLAENKGIRQLVSGFCRSTCYANTELHFHGQGPLLEEVVSLKAQHDAYNRVVLRGAYADDADLAERMAEMHGLVLTSQFGEGLPLVLIEAMSMGLPFFGTNICGIPDAAEDNLDCVLSGTDEEAISAGLADFSNKLLRQTFDNVRLRAFYDSRFHSEVTKAIWRNFLKAPSAHFTHYEPL
jgi:glycosyltransferase involved in cell wall biosynthesis